MQKVLFLIFHKETKSNNHLESVDLNLGKLVLKILIPSIITISLPVPWETSRSGADGKMGFIVYTPAWFFCVLFMLFMHKSKKRVLSYFYGEKNLQHPTSRDLHLSQEDKTVSKLKFLIRNCCNGTMFTTTRLISQWVLFKSFFSKRAFF